MSERMTKDEKIMRVLREMDDDPKIAYTTARNVADKIDDPDITPKAVSPVLTRLADKGKLEKWGDSKRARYKILL